MSSLPVFFFVFSILLSQFPTNSIASDFCIADLSQPDGPAGYPCKDPSKVTVDDFVYSGLAVPSGNTTNFYNSAIRSINIEQFPGLNGMKISMLRADLDVSGVTPFHAHRVAELLLGVEGSVVAGFIDSNNTAYYKTLNKGEVLIIPPALLHFFYNVDSTPAVTYSFYPSDEHHVQIIDFALFQSNLPSEMLDKVTPLDHAEVQKLKKLLGGTNL
ncbi:Auxin-binding protein ABP19a [Bienertia sinuspersici]